MDEYLFGQGTEQPQPENELHTVEPVAEDADFAEAPVYQPVQEPVQPQVVFARFDPMTGEPVTPVQPEAQERAEQFVEPVMVELGKRQPRPKEAKSSGKKALGMILAGLLIAFASSAITVLLVGNHWQEEFDLQNQVLENKIQAIREETSSGTGAGQSTNPEAPALEGMSASEVYAANVGAVVAVANEGVQTNIFGQVSRTASSGSGFIISADGYVVSNYHVIEGAQKLTVITGDGTEYDAAIVGYDESNDVSLLKIQGENLPYVTLGSSDALVVGDQVYAIGNPLGELTSTLTVGYVSAKERMVTTDVTAISMIQTDAAINSGNSGGPLFNTKGEVVGITTAKYSGTSGSGASIEGIGFAIPIDDVVGILEDLKEQGYVSSAYMGVSVRDVDSYGMAYGLPSGAFVQEVVSGSPAEIAGIMAQDIIINIGGYEIGSTNELLLALRKLEIGQQTTVTVYRAGQNINLNITLEEKPQQ